MVGLFHRVFVLNFISHRLECEVCLYLHIHLVMMMKSATVFALTAFVSTSVLTTATTPTASAASLPSSLPPSSEFTTPPGPAPLGPNCNEAVELFPNGAPYEVPGAVGKEDWSTAGGELHVYNVTRPTITYHCANRSNPNLCVRFRSLARTAVSRAYGPQARLSSQRYF